MADTIISKNDREDCLEFLEWVRENAEFEDFQEETFANGFMNLTNTLEFGSGGNQVKNESSNCNIQNVTNRTFWQTLKSTFIPPKDWNIIQWALAYLYFTSAIVFGIKLILLLFGHGW
jgi:hypothetical protein